MTTSSSASRELVAGEVLAHLARSRQSILWLSDSTGVSLATLYRRLQLKTPFTLDELVAISHALEIPVSDLIRPLTEVAS